MRARREAIGGGTQFSVQPSDEAARDALRTLVWFQRFESSSTQEARRAVSDQTTDLKDAEVQPILFAGRDAVYVSRS